METHQEISMKLSHLFQNILFEPSSNRISLIQNILNYISKLITLELNEALLGTISFDEVETKVKEIPRNKERGLDGFTIEFFQAWHSISENNVWQEIEELWQSWTILKAFDDTFLTLIPKK